MKLPRRRFLHLAVGAVALPAVSRTASALEYPTKPVRLIVGFAAGGGSDINARVIGQWLSDRLGQQFLIENRPGASSNIGTEAVVNSPPDGYTLLFVSSANAITATLYDKLNFVFLRDIAPVGGISRDSNVMVVHPAVPAKTVPEFITYAKGNPGKINMASAGVGSEVHMSGELFKMMTGVNMLHVPYRGAGPALTDLLGGQVHLMFVRRRRQATRDRTRAAHRLALPTDQQRTRKSPENIGIKRAFHRAQGGLKLHADPGG
jgi:tripartite-type tricarboxylate transporter receptor subunit TctC